MPIPKINLLTQINKWKAARFGREVRQANVEAFEQIEDVVNTAIQQCYNDATGNPESIAAHVGDTDNPHATSSSNLPVTDTSGILGTAGAEVMNQELINAMADMVMTKILMKSQVINNFLANTEGTVADGRTVAELKRMIGETAQLPAGTNDLVSAFNVLNTNKFNFAIVDNVESINVNGISGKYRILLGLIENTAYVSIDVNWIRIQFKSGSDKKLYYRVIYGNNESGEWNLA